MSCGPTVVGASAVQGYHVARRMQQPLSKSVRRMRAPRGQPARASGRQLDRVLYGGASSLLVLRATTNLPRRTVSDTPTCSPRGAPAPTPTAGAPHAGHETSPDARPQVAPGGGLGFIATHKSENASIERSFHFSRSVPAGASRMELDLRSAILCASSSARRAAPLGARRFSRQPGELLRLGSTELRTASRAGQPDATTLEARSDWCMATPVQR